MNRWVRLRFAPILLCLAACSTPSGWRTYDIFVVEDQGIAYTSVFVRAEFETVSVARATGTDDLPDYRLLDEEGRPVAATILPETWGRVRTHLTFRVAPLDARQQRRYRLVFGPAAEGAEPPPPQERFVPPQSGRGGYGVRRWSFGSIRSRAGDAAPFGQWLHRMRVSLIPSPMDHFTNEAAKIVPRTSIPIGPTTTLSYDLKKHQAGSFHGTVQARLDDGTFTWDNPAEAADGRPAHWSTPLDDCALRRWCHRSIPLGHYRGRRLVELFFMTNDEPNVEQGGEYVFDVDNVEVLPGPGPRVQVGTLWGELVWRLEQDPGFSLLWGGAILLCLGGLIGSLGIRAET